MIFLCFVKTLGYMVNVYIYIYFTLDTSCCMLISRRHTNHTHLVHNHILTRTGPKINTFSQYSERVFLTMSVRCDPNICIYIRRTNISKLNYLFITHTSIHYVSRVYTPNIPLPYHMHIHRRSIIYSTSVILVGSECGQQVLRHRSMCCGWFIGASRPNKKVMMAIYSILSVGTGMAINISLYTLNM